MKFIFSLLCIAILTSCGSSKNTKSKAPSVIASSTNPATTSNDHEPFLDVTDYSDNEDYGLSGKVPVKVGERSAENQRRYLASLAGPDGQELTFYRRGSCCGYETETGLAFVDIYVVSYEGLEEPIYVYISFYEYEPLYIPKGFTQRKL